MVLKVYHSNRLEILCERLAALLEAPLGSPFTPETIVVQGQAMARWLLLNLARHLGVCANVRFPFPARFIWEVFRGFLPGVPETSPFEPPILIWRIMAALRALQETPALAPVRAYLGGDDDLKRYQLAARVANAFDRYLIYRPDWIRRWEAGAEDHWQAALWRHLRNSTDSPHWVAVQQAFFAALTAEAGDPHELPERVALFAIPVLSPGYLQVLAGLAERIDVHLFLLNPCQAWSEAITQRSVSGFDGAGDSKPARLPIGNTLLASLSGQGRKFLDLLQEYAMEHEQAFLKPGEQTLLCTLQTDLLELREHAPWLLPATPGAGGDGSLQIHACHSPMREVEVLYDQLLALFEAHCDLSPSDVVVMAPDIEHYAPLIEAVFASAPAGRRIPFVIAGRQALAESALVEGFFALLDLPESRFATTEVLKLLEIPAVRRRFGLADADRRRVEGWIRDTAIRWGIDAGTRAKLGLPPIHEHSWRAGLERLLLGYALVNDADQFFADILPYDEVEGGDAEILGRLQSFVEAVFALPEALDQQRCIESWGDTLRTLMERFLAPSTAELSAVQTIRRAIEDLVQSVRLANYTEPIPLAVVKSALRQHLRQWRRDGYFPGGVVTCCAMESIRGIPFEVVCLIGLNDGSLPRPHLIGGIDRMTTDARRGDYSPREDDRSAFLEALLSARRCLHLSYVGQDIRDNTPIPPSELVSELLDYLAQGLSSMQGEALRTRLITHHPLQPFSPRYFMGDERLFSYNEAFFRDPAAEVAGEPGPFFSGRLPEPEADWRTIELSRLLRFYSQPARYLLQQRLGLWLPTNREFLNPREPFELDAIERSRLLQQLLKRWFDGKPLSEALPVLRARGELPHGEVGESVFRDVVGEVEAFANRLRDRLPEYPLGVWDVDLQFNGLHLVGTIDGMGPEGLVGFRLGRLRPQDWLSLWIRHLVLNVLHPQGVWPASCWIGQDQELLLQPVAAADQHLERLLELYWQGLRRPIHLFPQASFAYAKACQRAADDPLTAARQVWRGGEFADYRPGEGGDPYYQLAFRGTEPLDAEFMMLATEVFLPMLAHGSASAG